jgi:hypothetical protein
VQWWEELPHSHRFNGAPGKLRSGIMHPSPECKAASRTSPEPIRQLYQTVEPVKGPRRHSRAQRMHIVSSEGVHTLYMHTLAAFTVNLNAASAIPSHQLA